MCQSMQGREGIQSTDKHKVPIYVGNMHTHTVQTDINPLTWLLFDCAAECKRHVCTKQINFKQGTYHSHLFWASVLDLVAQTGRESSIVDLLFHV